MKTHDVSGDPAIPRKLRGVFIRFLVVFAYGLIAGTVVAGAQVVSSAPQSGPEGKPGKVRTAPLSIPELTGQSELVVHGKVDRVRSFWNEGKTRIYSIATVSIIETWKGESSGNTIEVRYPGGEIGSIGELYTHMPSFKADEEVVIFSRKGNDGTSRIVSGMEGKLVVSTGNNGFKKIGGKGMPLTDLKKSVQSATRDNQ